MTDRKSVWNEASIPGLVLAVVCIAYDLLSLLVGKVSVPVLAGVSTVVLWIAKFVGCIILLRLFMKKFAASDTDVDNGDTFRFGVVVSLLSAVAYSAFYFAYVMYIVPDLFDTAFDTVMGQYSQMMDAATMDQIENLKPSLPAISFVSRLIYCFIYGLLLSAILSRDIPSRNPFERRSDDVQ